jgi:Asp-tRNA(Asn)/Glu-tRNA(Gln) amidotransferase A subunit family amidase
MDPRQLMNPTVMALSAVVILAVAVFAWIIVRGRRRTTTATLRQRFGPEYERAVGEHGSERQAEAQLAARQKRVDTLKIRDLDPATREEFSGQWKALQSRFVDDPKAAITEADALVSAVMQARGYPVADFTQRAADISVDHPRVVANYRSAHEIALRLEQGAASTEDLRTAMIHYRSLFEELIQVPTAGEIKKVA